MDVRLAAVLFILLLGSVAFIRAENLSVVAEQVSSKVPCSSCPLASSSTAQVLNTTVLEGEDKNRAVATALSSEDYKNVKKLFPESVYAPSVENATAGIINLEANGTTYEISAVFIPFKAEAGLSAGIVFSIIQGHTTAIGAVVDLQCETPIFAVMSMDGKSMVIPLQWSSPCSSCGSGVSPMDYECQWDTDCWQLYSPEYCCANGQCVWCECSSDSDCLDGGCCVNPQCTWCGESPPSPSAECDWCYWNYNVAQQIGCAFVGTILIIVCTLVCIYFSGYCAGCWDTALTIITHVCAEIALGHCAEEACVYYCQP